MAIDQSLVDDTLESQEEIKDVMPSRLLVNLRKPSENTLQDLLSAEITNTSKIDTTCTL